MKFADKSKIIDDVLILARQSKLNNTQRARLLNVIENLEDSTEIQKERVIMYYGLEKHNSNTKKLNEIAKIYGVTISAIRISVVNTRIKIARRKEDFEIIEKIADECKMKIQ